MKYILCGRRNSAERFSGFAAIRAVTDAVATAELFSLVSPLVTVIGNLKYLMIVLGGVVG